MPSWNRLFTSILRNTYPVYWGNWSIDRSIQPGAVGTVLSDSGAFEPIGNLKNPEIEQEKSNIKWKLASNNISRTQSSVELDGSATDPETDTKISVGSKLSWNFNESEGLISEFSISRTSRLKNLTEIIQDEKAWLIQQAKIAGMGDGNTLLQGFGFISSVLYAKSGLNVGSSTKGNVFSLSGSISGVNELVGTKAEGNGSFTEMDSTSSVDLHIWPAQAETLADAEVPIAFTFVSFDGDIPLINWRQPIYSLILSLNNTHGGTYVVGYDLSYKYMNNTINKSGAVSGALTQAIGGIPLGATDMSLTLVFHGVFSSDTYKIEWKNPLSQWSSGTCDVDLYGVWPGQTRYDINFR